MKLYGREESFRPLNVALFQGQPDKKDVVTVQMAASDNPLLAEADARDAMLGTISFRLFSRLHADRPLSHHRFRQSPLLYVQ